MNSLWQEMVFVLNVCYFEYISEKLKYNLQVKECIGSFWYSTSILYFGKV